MTEIAIFLKAVKKFYIYVKMNIVVGIEKFYITSNIELISTRFGLAWAVIFIAWLHSSKPVQKHKIIHQP